MNERKEEQELQLPKKKKKERKIGRREDVCIRDEKVRKKIERKI